MSAGASRYAFRISSWNWLAALVAIVSQLALGAVVLLTACSVSSGNQVPSNASA